MSFPSKAEREKCWGSRDVFWKCLDDHRGDPETMKACAEFRTLYENSCPSQWVKHFDRKREYLKFKDRIQNDGLIQPFEAVGDLTLEHHHDHGQPDSQNDICLATTTRIISTSDLSESQDHNNQDEERSSLNSSTTTPKCPSPNTRIYRKFQPPTFSTYT